MEYDVINPALLYTLPQIQHKLNHTDREIDVLMLDCEGCEWGALRQLACNNSLNDNTASSVKLY